MNKVKGYFLGQRANPPSLAISLLRSGVKAKFLAFPPIFPPNFPKATAAGFFFFLDLLLGFGADFLEWIFLSGSIICPVINEAI
jgi:hypothetical protein